jgi:flagellar biosynthesis regulator FlbT
MSLPGHVCCRSLLSKLRNGVREALLSSPKAVEPFVLSDIKIEKALKLRRKLVVDMLHQLRLGDKVVLGVGRHEMFDVFRAIRQLSEQERQQLSGRLLGELVGGVLRE